MLNIGTPLFDAQDIRLGPIDHEADPAVESRWTHDAGFMRLMEMSPVRPLSPALIKKEYESLEKRIQEERDLHYFTIRTSQDDRLVGKAVIQWIDWTNGQGWLHLGIGAQQDRRRGLGSQAMRMLLRFVFAELNLYRLSALVPEYNAGAIRLLEKFGFTEEVRQRQALERDGRRWDLLILGLLHPEWQSSLNSGMTGKKES